MRVVYCMHVVLTQAPLATKVVHRVFTGHAFYGAMFVLGPLNQLQCTRMSARPLSYSSSFNQNTSVQSNNHSHLIHDHCFRLESGHMVANYESRLRFIEQDQVLAEYIDWTFYQNCAAALAGSHVRRGRHLGAPWLKCTTAACTG